MSAHGIRPSLGLLIAATLVPFYLFTYSGTFRVDDEHILGARAQSLALWGRLEAPQVSGNSRVQALQPMGDQATQIEPLQSILGAGLYRIGLAAGMGGQQAMFLLNLWATCLTAFVIFVTIGRLGFSEPAAAAGALLFGLGSMAWPYAETFIRDTLAMAMGAVAWLAWARVVRPAPGDSDFGTAALMVLGLVGGVLAKNTLVVLGVALACGAALLMLLNTSAPGPGLRRVGWALGGLFALALVVAAIPGQGVLARFSGSYYAFLAGHFWTQLWQGAWLDALGPFLSPARSIFLFSPPLLLLAGLPWARRKLPVQVSLVVVIFSVGLALAQALFYGAGWAGTFGWGLRFMLPALPPLILLIAPVIEALLISPRALGRIGLWGVLTASAVIQVAGSAVPWTTAFSQWQTQGLDPYTPAASWQAGFLVIPSQLAALVDPAHWDAAWVRLVRTGHVLAWAVPLACAVLLIGLTWQLRRIGQGERRATWVGLAALAVPLIVVGAFLRGDPALRADAPAFDRWQKWAATTLGPDDRVVVEGYADPLWTYMMNRWRLPVPWYSLTYRDPGAPIAGPSTPADQAILAQAAEGGGTVWLAASLPSLSGGGDSLGWVPTLGPPVFFAEGDPAVAVWQLDPSGK